MDEYQDMYQLNYFQWYSVILNKSIGNQNLIYFYKILNLSSSMNSSNYRRNIDDEIVIKDQILSRNYELIKKIGSGCFGNIFLALSYKKQAFVAIKLQTLNQSHDPQKVSLVEFQFQILQTLNGLQGIPRVYSYGKCNVGRYMQMQLMQSNLTFYTEERYPIDSNFLSKIAIYYFRIFEEIHLKRILHRDVKPENLMIKKGKYYIIDFGIANLYPEGFQSTLTKKSFVGTPRYASIRAHQGLDQSPKDDLQSLMYVLAHFYHKSLPWMGLQGQSSRMKQIKKIKIEKAKKLFEEISPNFLKVYQIIISIAPGKMPEYDRLITLLACNLPKTMNEINFERSSTKKLSLPLNKFSFTPSLKKKISITSSKEILNFSQQNQGSIGAIIINRVQKESANLADTIDNLTDQQYELQPVVPIKPLNQIKVNFKPFQQNAK